MNPDVGSQMTRGEERKPAGNVLFAERECLSCEQNEWIKDGAPGDLILIERIVQMAHADRVLGQDDRARIFIPDGKSPITNELAKTICAPFFVGGRDDGYVRGANGEDIS